MNKTILKLFGRALVSDNNLSFKVVNAVAVKMGYIVHPDICNADVLLWLESKETNFNSTFYKSWDAVISKNRLELYMDQLLHYASTYGTDFKGEVYLPEGEANLPAFNTFKIVSPITKDEVIDRCEKMLFSGIALKQETIVDIFTILDELDHAVNVDKVKNKEAKMILYEKTGALPSDATEMVRYLIFLTTGKTLLIKDKETIDAIKASGVSASFSGLINSFGIEKLSSVFYRYKPIFLALKKGKDSVCINKLRRLAVKNHIPATPSYFETILTNPAGIAVLADRLKSLGNFKKITLLQTISIRLKQLEIRSFGIRNQKLFIKQETVGVNAEYLKMVYAIIYSDLVQSMKDKACTINLPKGVNLTLPTSEKSFIGNYPIGTSFDFSDADNIVGINWRGEDGAEDLDLKMHDIEGNQYGWNVAYYNDERSIVYSGDMTSANPEATELFYTSNGFNPAIIKVNLYNGAVGSKFKFFLAKEKIVSMKQGYMVDPNNIILNVDCVMDSQEKSLGVITENKFILAQFRTGKGRVSNTSVTDLYTEYALQTLDCYVSLEKLLVDAGFIITDKNATIDLTNLSKDTLINLLAKQNLVENNPSVTFAS